MKKWKLILLLVILLMMVVLMIKLVPAPSVIDDTDTNWNTGTMLNMKILGTGGSANLTSNLSSGFFASQIFDAGANANWTNVTLVAEANYGFEIGRAFNDSITAPVNAPSINTSGLVLLMHFNNESEYGENNSQLFDYSVLVNPERNSNQPNNATCSTLTNGCPIYNLTRPRFGNLSMWFVGGDGQPHFNISDSGSINFTGVYSVAAWVYVTIGGTNCRSATVYSKQGPSGGVGTKFALNSGCKFTFRNQGNLGGTTVTSVATVSNNTWHHIAGTIDSAKLESIYIDGVLDNSATSIDFPVENGQSAQIGDDRSVVNGVWNGLIDELSLWNRSLSADEIKKLYLRGALRLNLSVRTCANSTCDSTPYNPIANATFGNPNIPINLSSTGRFFQYNLTYSNDTAGTPKIVVNNVTINYNYTQENSTITSLVSATGRTTFGYLGGVLNNTFYNYSIGAIQMLPNVNNATYLSQVFDLGTAQQFLNISWTPGAYYGSEIGRAYSDTNNGLLPFVNTTGLVGLWHFNNESAYGENDSQIRDFATQVNSEDTIEDNGTCNYANCPAYNFSNKRFGNASSYYNASAWFSVSNSAATKAPNSNFTITAWVMWTGATSPTCVLGTIAGKWDDGANGYFLGLNSNCKIRGDSYKSAAGTQTIGTTIINANQWYLVAYGGDTEPDNSRCHAIWVNGVRETRTCTDNWASTTTAAMIIGDGTAGGYTKWNGLLDEVALWNRTLSNAEILNLYKRGAARLNISVRSCSASDCSDNATFSMTNATNSTGTNLSVPNNRYIQYQANFQNFSVSPELYNVTIHYTALPTTNTCTPSSPLSADTGVNCADNCVFTADINLNKKLLYFYGTGTIISRNLFYNGNITIHQGCTFVCDRTTNCYAG